MNFRSSRARRVSIVTAAAFASCPLAALAGFVGCSSNASDGASKATYDASSILPITTATAMAPTGDDAGADATIVVIYQDSGPIFVVRDTGMVDEDEDDGGDDAEADAGPEDCDASVAHPRTLNCTGLYTDFANKVVDPSNVAYDPGLHLWSDGADKQRWIRLPPNTTIDTSNMDEWTFPIGTRIWKEFAFSGQRVETRYMLKEPDGSWLLTTYQWSNDQMQAPELTTGLANANDAGYEIPASNLCINCHEGRIDDVLGFEAISLSQSSASGLTIHQLKAQNVLSNPPAAPYVIPGDAGEVAALGFLHANCGNACHNRSPMSFAGATSMYMRLTTDKLGSVQMTDTYTTTVGVTSTYQPAKGDTYKRINPGDHTTSMIWVRDSTRDNGTTINGVQMPPFDTHVVPTSNVNDVAAWIDSL